MTVVAGVAPPSFVDNKQTAESVLKTDLGYPDPLPGQVESFAALLSLWQAGSDGSEIVAAQTNGNGNGNGHHRRRLPNERSSVTHKFVIGGQEGYITAGLHEDGTLGEIFLTGVGKEGDTLRGMIDAFAIVFSIALQYGMPLESITRKLSYMNFEPHGLTDNKEIRNARSIPDYLARWLSSRFLDDDMNEELGVMTDVVKTRKSEAA